MISYRGLGLTQEQCTGGAYTGQSFWQCLWAGIAGYDPTGSEIKVGGVTPLAVPRAPSGVALVTPPANEEEAKALLTQLEGERWVQQQEINQGIVTPVFSLADYVTGGTGYGGPPDCTKTWTALVNSECPSLDLSQYYPWLIGAGVLVLILATGSGRRR